MAYDIQRLLSAIIKFDGSDLVQAARDPLRLGEVDSAGAGAAGPLDPRRNGAGPVEVAAGDQDVAPTRGVRLGKAEADARGAADDDNDAVAHSAGR